VAATVYEQLVAAFRARDAERAVALSGYLSHYASDAHSPYHATVNYDGQLSGNPGIHGRYEADMIEAHESQVESGLSSRVSPAARPVSVSEALFEALLHGVTLVDGINSVDIASGGNIMALWSGTGSEATGLMATSVGLVNALWIAAYADAGAPLMPGMPSRCDGVPAPDAGVWPDAGGSTPDSGPGPSDPDAGTVPPVDPDAGLSMPPDPNGACACDVDFCCSEGCTCDAECGCACDATYSCDEGCACDPECHAGCTGYVDPKGEDGGSCQSLMGPHPGEVLILLLGLALVGFLGRRRRI
jgi:hypothetical protein